MTTRIRLRGAQRLPAAVERLEKNIIRGLHAIAYKAAGYARTRAQMRARRTGATASQTYERSFIAERTPDGAVMANTAEHAIFVELGRRPGKMPPVRAIMRWLIAKGLISGKLPKVNTRGITKMPADASRAEKRRMKGRLREAAADYRLRKREQAHGEAYAYALAIARKIARKGTRGKYIVRDTVADAQRYVQSELRRMNAAIGSMARG